MKIKQRGLARMTGFEQYTKKTRSGGELCRAGSEDGCAEAADFSARLDAIVAASP